MTDKDDLLRRAEELRRSAESVKHLDEAVERRSNAGKRQNLVEAIEKVQINYLYTSQAKVAKQAGTIQGELVKSVNGRLLPDLSSIANYRILYEGAPNWDTASERHLIASECFTRIDLLKKQILAGKFDHLLENNAVTLVHGVMGYNGELLEALGIDPKQGETYRRITETQKFLLDAGPQETSQLKNNSSKLAGTVIGLAIKKFVEDRTPRQPTITPPTKASAEKDRVTEIDSKTRSAAELKMSDIAEGIPTFGNIGIIGYTLNDAIVSNMGLERETRGVLVIGVFKNSIAEKAGLRAGTTPTTFGGVNGMLGGDVIIGINDITIDKMEELVEYLSLYHKQGTQIKFRLLRNRKPIEINLIY